MLRPRVLACSCVLSISFLTAAIPLQEDDRSAVSPRDAPGTRFVRASQGDWTADHPEQGLRTRIGATGLTVEPLDAGATWQLELRTARFGWRTALLEPVATPASAAPAGVERRTDAFVEWYRADARGLEQGWTIPTPPPGDAEGPLVIELEVGGTLRPTLRPGARALHFVDEQGAFAARYGGLEAFDAGGRELEATMRLVGPSVRIEVEVRDAAWPIVVDPVIDSQTQDWLKTGGSDEALGLSVSTAGDVNGDGYSDAVAGGYRGFHVYYGSASGLGNGTWMECPPGCPSGSFGAAVSTAGDVNGDGYDDVIVAGSYFDSGYGRHVGQAWIFFGSAIGLEGFSTAWVRDGDDPFVETFAADVSAAGDVNGDGLADVLVSAAQLGANGFPTRIYTTYVFLGVQGGAPAHEPWCALDPGGRYLSTAGDVNGDGYADIVVGSDNVGSPTYLGEMRVFLGSPDEMIPAQVLAGEQENDGFGGSVANAGDVNGDGYADVLVGALGFDGPQGDLAGRVYLYTGSPAGIETDPLSVLDGTGYHDWLGSSVSTAGDVNGDGYADVLTGSSGWNPDGNNAEWGKCDLWLGRADGLGAIPAWTYQATQNQDLGQAVATSGDVNGDGYSDLLLGAPFYQSGALLGRVYGFHGSADGIDTSFRQEVSLESQDGITIVGDVNGDGYDDALVGEPLHTNPEPNEGRILLHYGSREGLVMDVPAWWFESSSENAYFGHDVAPAGDMNGDGFADFMASTKASSGASLPGVVLVWFGASDFETRGPNSAPNWVLEPIVLDSDYDENISYGRTRIAAAGDVDLDGYGDILVGKPDWLERNEVTAEDVRAGAAFLFRGGPGDSGAAPVFRNVATADWTVVGPLGPYGGENPPCLGSDVAGAGDVDGDGFDDVLVSANARANGYGSGGFAKQVRLHLSDGRLPREQPAITLTSAEDSFGFSVAGAGDLDRDGKGDVIVGAPYSLLQNKGRLFLYSGWNGFTFGSVTSQFGPNANQLLGYDVAAAGDVDGDGKADYVAGAPGTGVGTIPMVLVQCSSEGALYLEEPLVDGPLGRSVAAGGDLNGDGFCDVVASPAAVIAYYGNLAFPADGASLAVPPSRGHAAGQFDPTTGARVVLGGACEGPLSLGLRVFSAAGRQTMRAGWSWGALGHPESFTATSTAPFDTGFPGPEGSVTPAELQVFVDPPYRAFQWAARLRSVNNPYFPTSPWIHLTGNSLDEAKYRRRRTHKGERTGRPSPTPVQASTP